jgi:hypothetical protein
VRRENKIKARLGIRRERRNGSPPLTGFRRQKLNVKRKTCPLLFAGQLMERTVQAFLASEIIEGQRSDFYFGRLQNGERKKVQRVSIF